MTGKRDYSGWGNTMHPFGELAWQILTINKMKKDGLVDRACELYRQTCERFGELAVVEKWEDLARGGYVDVEFVKR